VVAGVGFCLGGCLDHGGGAEGAGGCGDAGLSGCECEGSACFGCEGGRGGGVGRGLFE